MPALEVSLADLGIDLRSQQGVELDIEQRPKKSPRAFCAPIEVQPRDALIQPWAAPTTGGRSSTRPATGTTPTSADLPVEARRLGDVSVTEAGRP